LKKRKNDLILEFDILDVFSKSNQLSDKVRMKKNLVKSSMPCLNMRKPKLGSILGIGVLRKGIVTLLISMLLLIKGGGKTTLRFLMVQMVLLRIPLV
jgi:hypothetical protein